MCRPQASASKPTSIPKPWATLPSWARSAAERSMPPRLSGDTFEQTRMRAAPSSFISANLRFARSKPRERFGSGMPSKSRNGWKATISSPWSRTMRPISAGEPLCASTSASKSSTPSNPAVPIAASFSANPPPSDTVAIENFIGARQQSNRATSRSSSGVAARKPKNSR
jgi:hypothetical protein